MVSELSTLIHNLVLDNPVPAKDLAKAIGKPYSTLLARSESLRRRS